MQPTVGQEEQEREINGSPENPRNPYTRLEKGGSQSRSQRTNIGSNIVRSVETAYLEKAIPPWKDQLTIRALVTGLALGSFFLVLLMKQSLIAGFVFPVNLYPGLVGFSCVKTWIEIIGKCGIIGPPFTRQENALIQACVLAITRLADSGGFADYLFAMGTNIQQQAEIPEDDAKQTKDPRVTWIIPFLLVTSFVGLVAMLPLRKCLLINLKLVYPSGQAVGQLINCINSPFTTKFARKQLTTFGNFFTFSCAWSCFLWVFSGGATCGLSFMPIFGFTALFNRFSFDFFGTGVGIGMMCPFNTTLSVVFGSIIFNAFLRLFLEGKSGVWYDAEIPTGSYRGKRSYQEFIGLSLMLSDSIYNILKLVVVSLFHKLRNNDAGGTSVHAGDPQAPPQGLTFGDDEEIRTQNFVDDGIPTGLAMAGFAALVAVSTVVLPLIFRPLKWYHVVAMYVICPLLAFCQVRVRGLCDVSLPSTFGKASMFIFGAWAGKDGGIMVALIGCGVVTNFVTSASDLMTDLKTSYLTMASTKSVVIFKLIGTVWGCFISSVIYLYYVTRYGNDGNPSSTYGLWFAPFFRQTAIDTLQGFSALPKYCLQFAYAFFTFGVVMNVIREVSPKRVSRFIPLPVAMAIPIYAGGKLGISLCIGNFIASLYRWRKKDKADAVLPVVGAALICGDGLWTLLNSVMDFIGWRPPLCMRFFASDDAV